MFWRKIKEGKIVLTKGYEKYDYSIDFLIWCSAITVIVSVLSLRISVFYRIVPYCGMYCYLLIPNLIYQIKNSRKKKMIYFTTIIVGFLVWFIISMFRPEWYDAVPYTSSILNWG